MALFFQFYSRLAEKSQNSFKETTQQDFQFYSRLARFSTFPKRKESTQAFNSIVD